MGFCIQDFTGFFIGAGVVAANFPSISNFQWMRKTGMCWGKVVGRRQSSISVFLLVSFVVQTSIQFSGIIKTQLFHGEVMKQQIKVMDLSTLKFFYLKIEVEFVIENQRQKESIGVFTLSSIVMFIYILMRLLHLGYYLLALYF